MSFHNFVFLSSQRVLRDGGATTAATTARVWTAPTAIPSAGTAPAGRAGKVTNQDLQFESDLYLYMEVYLDFTPEMEVLYLRF